jgi:hypothetical protein
LGVLGVVVESDPVPFCVTAESDGEAGTSDVAEVVDPLVWVVALFPA